MWPQFFQDLWIRWGCFSLLCLFSRELFANNLRPELLGPIQVLDELTKINDKEVAENKGYYSLDYRASDGLGLNLDLDLKIAPYFLRSTFLHSDLKYLDIMKESPCSFFALLENDLIGPQEKQTKQIPLFYKGKKGIPRKFSLEKSSYFKYLYRKKCVGNQDLSFLFKRENLKKTLTSIELPAPNSLKECSEILTKWKKNPHLPYLCTIERDLSNGEYAEFLKGTKSNITYGEISKINEFIRKKNFLKTELSLSQRTYIQNLCSNLLTPHLFCSQYVSRDTWNMVLQGERPKYILEYKCKNMLQKSGALTMEDLGKCSRKYQISPKICINKGGKNHPSQRPFPNCTDISHALENSHLKTDYHDCPGLIDNEGIINTVRIINHFEEEKKGSIENQSCSDNTNYQFAKLNIDYNDEKAWPLKMCFKDRAIDEEICWAYIPGNDHTNELSESKIAGKILYKIVGAPSQTICEKIEKHQYNPEISRFKIGCYIVYDQTKCNNFYCPRKILYDNREITEIQFKGFVKFDYFKSSFTNEKFSINNILKETYKLKMKEIRNISELRHYIKSYPSAIIHGMGCLEDLDYQSFSKVNFNSCTAIPFIVDGIYENSESDFWITLRLSIDDIHSPRLVRWNHIFSAVASYQALHPLKTWNFYGVKKN